MLSDSVEWSGDAIGADTVGSVLLRQACARGDAPFLVTPPHSDGPVTVRTYRETADSAARLAGVLRRFGVERGSRVHVHLDNDPIFVEIWLAVAILGAVLVPTNPNEASEHLAYVVSDCAAVISVTDPEHVGVVRTAYERAGGSGAIVLTRPVDGSSEHPDLGISAPDAPPVAADHSSPDDTAAILYTSGTTSNPKGVLVSHANYLHAGEVVAQNLRIRPDDRWLVALPLFHANAQYYCVMSALVSGASVALTMGFSASRWGQQASELCATLGSLFAAPIRMILAAPERPDDDANQVRAVLFAQNLRDEQVAAFESRFGTPLVQLYGMTETIAPATMNPLYGDRRPRSIGRPLVGIPLRIVDRDGSAVADGVPGELLVGGRPGYTVMAGYHQLPESTSAAFADGWLHTGDIVTRDADGYLYFVDRAKDVIKRSGENVAASEVERVLDDHPAVVESAVIGVPDELRDEALVAFVVLAPVISATPDELITWCAERLARFKVPSDIRFIDRLPRTSVGKIRKSDLRECTL